MYTLYILIPRPSDADDSGKQIEDEVCHLLLMLYSSSRMLKNRDEQSCVSLEVILSSLLVACWLPCRACCDLGPCDRRTHHCHCRYQTPNLNRINCVKHFRKPMHKKSEMQLFEYVWTVLVYVGTSRIIHPFRCWRYLKSEESWSSWGWRLCSSARTK